MAVFQDAKDRDGTLVLLGTWLILTVLLAGIFVLEIRNPEQSYLTPELLHFLFGSTFGAWITITTFHFMKVKDNGNGKEAENESVEGEGHARTGGRGRYRSSL